ncbi:tyrosine-tRNA ligase [Kockovaella imperatae]|uniref:Tyrosine--tRNA ligase n=1 Tax=Kockovaella imperatae TaxID=4999 RepID=A0A1Y1UCV3_9TREE|nr:tyrosine-tRNA ligase [Kockovaella imperatae]ORX35881.1 tyrosine-tRNA ligase [Kockovaella imperatae]
MRALFRAARASSRLFSTSHASRQHQNVLDELEARGFVAAVTSPTIRQHVNSPSCIYSGVDPSAPSLHVGNLLPLMGLLHFHLAGHEVIALVGGATGSIGDPSGRSSERPILSAEQLKTNVEGITGQIGKFFARGEELASLFVEAKPPVKRHPVKVLNNLEWFGQMSLLDFLRGTGKQARVSAMLSKESVKSRLADGGISFTEFSYQLLQAHDFSVLNQEYGCRIQLGGSDQWGNIVAGIDLINRQRKTLNAEEGPIESESQDEVFGMTLPLLTTASGEKFGKSAGNAVWLDACKTSVSDLYQFFYRQPDSMVEVYLKTLTLLPLATIEETLARHRERPQERIAQRVLAEQVTHLIHGEDVLQKCLRAAELLFNTPLSQYRSEEIAHVFATDTRFKTVSWNDIESIPLRKIMATYGLTASSSAAAKACAEGAVSVNGAKVLDHKSCLDKTLMLDDHLFILKLGKKDQFILYVE